jgi:hypothetical protein
LDISNFVGLKSDKIYQNSFFVSVKLQKLISARYQRILDMLNNELIIVFLSIYAII